MTKIGLLPEPQDMEIQSVYLLLGVLHRLCKHILNDSLKQVILGHLSKENNYPDLALATVENEIRKAVAVEVAPRDYAGQLYDLSNES